MQPTLVLSAPHAGILTINGRFAGEISSDYPLLRPVGSQGAVYLDYRPLSGACRSMARKLVFSGGEPMQESVEAAEDLNVIIWPGGTVEIEFTPQARDAAPRRNVKAHEIRTRDRLRRRPPHRNIMQRTPRKTALAAQARSGLSGKPKIGRSRARAADFLVPAAGLEPARCCHRGILSPLRLPVSPRRHAPLHRTTAANTCQAQEIRRPPRPRSRSARTSSDLFGKSTRCRRYPTRTSCIRPENLIK